MDTEFDSRYGKWFNPPDIVNFLTMILYLILWVEVQIQTSEESCCSALDDSYNGKKINQENVFIFSSAKRIVVYIFVYQINDKFLKYKQVHA